MHHPENRRIIGRWLCQNEVKVRKGFSFCKCLVWTFHVFVCQTCSILASLQEKAYLSPVSIWSLTIATIPGIVAIAENIRSLRSSQLLKFDFHIVAGIVQIAGRIRSLWSSRSLRSLCYGFHMIAGIVTIVGSRWDRWRSLAKWKFGFHMIVTIAEHFASDPSDRERSPTIIWKPGFTILSRGSCYITLIMIQTVQVKSVQSALGDLLTTSAMHGTFSCPSTKRGLILIGLELSTNARESFEHCWSYSLNLSIDQHVCQFIS